MGRRCHSVRVYAEVDVEDVLDDIPDEQLVEELKQRRAHHKLPEFIVENLLDEAADELRAGRRDECLVLLSRALGRRFVNLAPVFA